MELLVLTNNPDRASYRQRIGIYLPMLRDHGIACRAERFPSGWRGRYRLLSSAGRYDAVFLHKRRLNIIDAAVLRRHARTIIYDFDDAMMVRDADPWRDDRLRKRRFARTVCLADVVIAGNAYLADQARLYNPDVHILPTGLAVDEYARKAPAYACAAPGDSARADDRVRLVWIGSRSTLGYLKSIAPVLDAVGREFPNVVLRIVCDDFFDLDRMPVEKHRWSLDTQAQALAECDIGLGPLPDDPFTRGKCGFKLLQYAAAGLPCVASPVGVNVEIVRDGAMGFLADGPDDWVDRLSTLIADSSLRSQMGRRGRQYVRAYDVGVIGERLLAIVTGAGGRAG